MRTDCSWSMSTAGLTAQEICLPVQSLFQRGSHWHSMAGAKPSWKYHDLRNLYISLDTSMDYNLQSKQQVLSSYSGGDKQRTHHLQSPNSPGGQPLPTKKNRPSQLTLLSDNFTSNPVEDELVVPCFQRLTVSKHISPPQTPSRATKPLPPIPGSAELSPEQGMDSEVEFFNGDDSHCLVSEPCSKHSSFRYGMPSRRSFRGCGQINYAYYEGPTQQKDQPHPHPQPQPQPQKQRQERETQQREKELRSHHHQQQQQERTQRKLRRSHSGPAGCFNKPTSFRLSSHNRNLHGLEKPEVPPRVPIPPRPIKTGDYRRWSAEVSSGANSDEDRPPKVPPREPLSCGSSRTPSPKSLPMYLNGIMPPTQSFAPDPKYVSRGLQRQNSEGSPCILPVMENGRKASTTHYFLLPQRPSYLDKHEKYLMDSTASRGTDASDSSSDWECQSKRKTTHQIDLV
ncbi:ERBB receptor feedback inhibitor 1-like [Myxocyprinus asiaticus]|uniref:ERBB receptor feedback inhibitor 1-like n=1 Tax=Myxocyprinus asiaticus TaxID=70543 RepID=UPI002222DC25|nr:ERBB receptor feedback inhibitor 1-like [Myxocyprinus asiaticus]XP_051531751.1 ERBB receptor feedback inhibitor 1-like [Myxocyprinus asiaticus]XP_051531752.1 ERBB receptor feedback inhibitor 1-like [Myxocyprinus asiaticus]XP_051531753.1 ERBB receptor feedback inhibitor 1-like [Myxocyprinus asiaticus]